MPEGPSIVILSEQAHPDDRAARDAAVARAHDPSGDGRYNLQYRVIRPDGVTRWVHTRSQTFFTDTPSGRVPARVIGAITDVTDARAAAEARRPLIPVKEELARLLEARK